MIRMPCSNFTYTEHVRHGYGAIKLIPFLSTSHIENIHQSTKRMKYRLTCYLVWVSYTYVLLGINMLCPHTNV